MTRNKKIRIVAMKHVKNQKIEWLWRNWLAIGKLTIFSGEAEIGKMSISMDIASTRQSPVYYRKEEIENWLKNRCPSEQTGE